LYRRRRRECGRRPPVRHPHGPFYDAQRLARRARRTRAASHPIYVTFAMRTTAVSLEIREASVFYGANRVLDRVSLSAAGGEFIALLGASGCGKTTLLRAICGFVPLASGSIAVGRRDITKRPPDKRDIAMVFQSYALWPHMTVAQNIGYGLKLRGVSRVEIARRISELLAMLRLEGL